MVCFSYRYKSAARYAREIVQSGALGQIFHVSGEYFQGHGLPHAGCPLVWRFIKEYAITGALGDLGCHMIDLIRFITGREFKRITAEKGYIESVMKRNALKAAEIAEETMVTVRERIGFVRV